MKLSQVPRGTTFVVDGVKMKHDLLGRDGSGHICVREVGTGKKHKLAATTEVETLPKEIEEGSTPIRKAIEKSDFVKEETEKAWQSLLRGAESDKVVADDYQKLDDKTKKEVQDITELPFISPKPKRRKRK